MRKTGWIAGALLAASLAGGAPAGAQNVKAGVDAWGRGDFDGAVTQWRGPAVAGDADAQFNLGQAYKLGRGVPLDPALAESWFRKAALQGHHQAEDNYGLALFQAGRKAEAAPWLEKSVARGEPRGQLVLGTMLFNGDGVPRDYPRAYALMTLASQSGLKSASETLAQMDQYISPADRERGTALAQRYAADVRNAPIDGGRGGKMAIDATPPRRGGIATADVPPSRPPADQPRPQKLPPRGGPERVPAPSPDRPVNDRIAHHDSRPAPARPAPAPAATGGGWKIQLGAFSTQANAQTQWSRVRGKLGGAQPVYAKAGNVIRLQASGFASKAAAQKACSASGVSCVVVAP
ncbi:SPOR domain-containing protein [Sphingomonas sp. RP10(2022)]|uniref:SPOR domain-containing protein n=1 Tax=Sphingomonas liriopis TaxID=2949094 RepID=A0A9X2HRH3_9SPHN|nr:SPOR domain-containing protein [Sphingomonas liriopis]MCP3734527.1 SPOR domain-containing protein [Sphingomonas liriopis]